MQRSCSKDVVGGNTAGIVKETELNNGRMILKADSSLVFLSTLLDNLLVSVAVSVYLENFDNPP